MTNDFIEITDMKGEKFTLNKKHILKVSSVKNDKDGEITRISLDLPDEHLTFSLIFVKENYSDFINRL